MQNFIRIYSALSKWRATKKALFFDIPPISDKRTFPIIAFNFKIRKIDVSILPNTSDVAKQTAQKTILCAIFICPPYKECLSLHVNF